MKLSQVSTALLVSAQAGIATMLWGQPGIGKSDAVMQTARRVASMLNLRGVREYGDTTKGTDYFGLHDVRLSQCDPVDIRGLPTADGDQTAWLVPDWFPHTGRDDLPNFGILFLDEVPNAPPSVQAAAYQLVLDRRIGDHVMQPGWSIVLAGNRLTDGGNTFKMPLPLCNRLVHVDVDVDLDEWCNWAIDVAELPLELVAFIRFQPDLLNTFEKFTKEKQSGHAFCTPRSWAMVGRIFKAINAMQPRPDAGVLASMLAGSVGDGAAGAFMGFVRVWESMPSIDSILANPDSVAIPTDSATMYAVCTALASRYSNDTIVSIVRYVSRMQKEYAILCMSDILRRCGAEIWKNPVFTKWATDNHEVMACIRK